MDRNILTYCALALLCVFLLVKCRRKSAFPPGPNLAFLIHSAAKPTSEQPEVLLQKWAQKFGDVMYIHLLGKSVIILSSVQAARDLLDKRSAIYSDRPRLVSFNELMGLESSTTAVRYGPRLRKHRRFMHEFLNERAVRKFRPVQERETFVLLENLLDSPDEFESHFKRYAAATTFAITYGHQISSLDDEYLRLADRVINLTAAEGTPGTTPVDLVPVLKHIPTWMPFSGFKRRALTVRNAWVQMINLPFNMVKATIQSGNAAPCFVSTLLETHCKPGTLAATEDEEDIKAIAGTLYAGAGDTTVSVLTTFILAMTRHPEVYKKAQEEMDRVVGDDRLPTFEDRPALRYMECVFKEVLRLNPPSPFGIPHRLIQDDVYQGYAIPEGATVIPNIYAMLQAYPQPELFRPERFADSEENGNHGLEDPRDLIFGFGRSH